MLLLLARKGDDEDVKKAVSSAGEDLEKVTKVRPDIMERAQKRRETMEKFDIFSPDCEHERLEELFDATQRLYEKGGSNPSGVSVSQDS